MPVLGTARPPRRKPTRIPNAIAAKPLQPQQKLSLYLSRFRFRDAHELDSGPVYTMDHEVGPPTSMVRVHKVIYFRSYETWDQ